MDEFKNNEITPDDESTDNASVNVNDNCAEPNSNETDYSEYTDSTSNQEDGEASQFFDPFSQPSQYVPNFSFSEPRPSKQPNKGVKIFALILAAVIILSLGVSGGYFLGIYNSKNPNGTAGVDLNLEPRPEDTSKMFKNYNDAFKNVDKSVVSIMVYSPVNNALAGIASGVIYSEDGYIVTNDHIYDGIPKAKFIVRLSDGKEYNASFVAGDVRSDLAVIKIDEKVSKLPVATFGDSNDVIVGEHVITVGYPSSYGDSSTLSHGIISAVNRRVTSATTSYASSFLQTDAVINPGNSGGALANMYGQVIGITSSKLAGDEYDAVSYAIPTVTMKKVVTALIKDGCVKDRAKLGITYTEVNKLISEKNNVPLGVYIQSIGSDSDMADKGVSKGDIITHVNGKEITNSDILLEVIENSKSGDSIELTVYISKTEKTKTINVKLLADKGTSSYNANNSSNKEDNTIEFDDFFEDNDENSSEKSENPKDFDFPLD